jgi:DNA-binding SARP family transcriptional activator
MLNCKQQLRRLASEQDLKAIEKWATALQIYEPLDEELQEFLLDVYFASNQRSAFVKQYIKWENILVSERGIKPNERLQTKYLQMKKY